ncbi:MAG: hypothetical protein IJ007_06230 [Oscillospiraceae bacterium]|nr:hypothetical protein [Oscillospiraceae bacterium]
MKRIGIIIKDIIPENPSAVPAIEKMTVAQLKEYAAENDIDLGTAEKKADILAIISAVSSEVDE